MNIFDDFSRVFILFCFHFLIYLEINLYGYSTNTFLLLAKTLLYLHLLNFDLYVPK